MPPILHPFHAISKRMTIISCLNGEDEGREKRRRCRGPGAKLTHPPFSAILTPDR